MSDAAGNAATQVTRTVNVTADATAPVITLLGADPVNIELGNAYIDAGATAADNIDLDITANVNVVSTVNTGVVGIYSVTDDVSDAAGNAATQVTQTVNVTADATAPVSPLLGADPVNIELGNAYIDAGATAAEDIDLYITDNINALRAVTRRL
mgnify:CR=1 FL=1